MAIRDASPANARQAVAAMGNAGIDRFTVSLTARDDHRPRAVDDDDVLVFVTTGRMFGMVRPHGRRDHGFHALAHLTCGDSVAVTPRKTWPSAKALTARAAHVGKGERKKRSRRSGARRCASVERRHMDDQTQSWRCPPVNRCRYLLCIAWGRLCWFLGLMCMIADKNRGGAEGKGLVSSNLPHHRRCASHT